MQPYCYPAYPVTYGQTYYAQPYYAQPVYAAPQYYSAPAYPTQCASSPYALQSYQLNRFPAFIAQYDRNGNGFIDINEAMHALQQFYGSYGMQAPAYQMLLPYFQRYGFGGTGYVQHHIVRNVLNDFCGL